MRDIDPHQSVIGAGLPVRISEYPGSCEAGERVHISGPEDAGLPDLKTLAGQNIVGPQVAWSEGRLGEVSGVVFRVAVVRLVARLCVRAIDGLRRWPA